MKTAGGSDKTGQFPRKEDKPAETVMDSVNDKKLVVIELSISTYILTKRRIFLHRELLNLYDADHF